MVTPAKLGDTLYVDVITRSPSAGVAVDADSTPTCEVFEDANDTAILSPTVVKRASKTGDYRVPLVLTTANGFEVGKSYNVIVSATVASLADKAKIATLYIQDPKRPSAAVVADGGNTATTFKTDLTESTTDYWKDALLLFVTGDLINQVKKVSGYNGSTKFVTLASAFTAAPAASDVFVLVNY